MKDGLEAASDRELVARFQAAPESAEGRRAASCLLGRYRERVYLWLVRYVRDHERALELAQEVLLSAWRALPRFEWKGEFSTWLYVLARNRARSEARRGAWLRDEQADPDARADEGAGPEELAVARDEERVLLDLMAEHLEPVERRALWLRCVDGMPVDEITELLEIRLASGARGVLQSARRKLRAALEARRTREDREGR